MALKSNRFSLSKFLPHSPKPVPVTVIAGDLVDERLANTFVWRHGDGFVVRSVSLTSTSGVPPDLFDVTDGLLLILVSPSVSDSRWLRDVVEGWWERQSPDSLCFGLTDGSIQWSPVTRRLDPTATTALPRALDTLFEDEPSWVDLRGSRDRSDFKLNDLRALERLPRQSRWHAFFSPGWASVLDLMGGFSSPAGEAREKETVYLGASSPRRVSRGTEFTARFVAYQFVLEAQIEEILQGLSPRSERHLGMKYCNWREGTSVLVALSGRGVDVAQKEQSFCWNGGFNVLEFDCEVGLAATERVTVLKFDVIVSGVAVAGLRVDLEICDGIDGTPEVRRSRAQTARSAFASYASQDRLRVLDRIAELEKMIHLDVFLDCLSLHPGDEWKPELARCIQARDLFMLFWSKHAADSEWVRWEWQTALREKGLSAIDPHPLDPPDEAVPPAELQSLHFGDKYMLIRRGFAASGG